MSFLPNVSGSNLSMEERERKPRTMLAVLKDLIREDLEALILC